mmetsp:Transcript_100541/g.216960  ORF Transcript_100541/g.216960 Transcript_100541/m.216960 type:complete len:1169 (-) Transcript_100541:76-3582(-)
MEGGVRLRRKSNLTTGTPRISHESSYDEAGTPKRLLSSQSFDGDDGAAFRDLRPSGKHGKGRSSLGRVWDACFRRRETICLSVSLVGHLILVMYKTDQTEMFVRTLVLFVLPVTSAWQVTDYKLQLAAPFHIYMVIHVAMSCSLLQDTFWQSGWQYCLMAFVSDGVLLGMIHGRAAMREDLVLASSTHLSQLLAILCDGCCILSETGTVVLSDSRFCDLVGTNSVEGMSFNSILAKGESQESGRPREGVQRVNIKTAGGGQATFETYTQMFQLPVECLGGINEHAARKVPDGATVFLRTMREDTRRLGSSAGGKQVLHRDLGSLSRDGPTDLASLRGQNSNGIPTSLRDLLPSRDEAQDSNFPRGVTQSSQSFSQRSNTSDNDISSQRLDSLRFKSQESGISGHNLPDSSTDMRRKDIGKDLSKLRSQDSGQSGGPSGVGAASDVNNNRFKSMASDVSDNNSDIASSVSCCTGVMDSFSNQTLTERRLQLMGGGRTPSSSAMGRLTLEMELPVVSEVSFTGSNSGSRVGGGSTVLSDADVFSSISQAFKSSNINISKGGSRSRRTMSMNSLPSMVSSVSDQPEAVQEQSSEEESVATEVLSVSDVSDGRVKVQLGFHSNLLFKQQAKLDRAQHSLNHMKRNMQTRVQLQEQQTAVLRQFQKIVTRDYGVDVSVAEEVGRPDVTVYIFDDRPDVVEHLESLCREAGKECRSFPSLAAGREAGIEEELFHGMTQGEMYPNPPGGGMELLASRRTDDDTKRGRSVQSVPLLLLGATLLGNPSAVGWTDLHTVLVTRDADELEEVRTLSGFASKQELLENLLTQGVLNTVALPLTASDLRKLSSLALEHRFGGEYLLAQHLGRGATAVVFHAKQLRSGLAFALKEINVSRFRRGTLTDQDLESIWREVTVLKQLCWPSVVPLYDAWMVDRKLLYMLQPALENSVWTALQQASKSGAPIQAKCVAEWYSQVLHCVTYLHWSHVVHRDIKVENLVLSQGGRLLKVCDFGSAAHLYEANAGEEGGKTYVPGDVTTPRITAPEVFKVKMHFCSSDCWSVGATAYEMLTMSPLFPANEPLQRVEERVLETNTASLWGQGSSKVEEASVLVTSPKIAEEVSDLLQKDHRRRPTAAALLAKDHNIETLRRVFGTTKWETRQRAMHFVNLERVLKDSTVT